MKMDICSLQDGIFFTTKWNDGKRHSEIGGSFFSLLEYLAEKLNFT